MATKKVAEAAEVKGGLREFAKAVLKKFGRVNKDIVLDPNRRVDYISSGCVLFNAVSGGGFPRGRITELFGNESSGKTSLITAAAAGVQASGGVTILIDAEKAFVYSYARQFGLAASEDNFVVFQPDNVEEVGDIVDLLHSSGQKVDLLIFDSVDAMKPKAWIEGSLGENEKVGAHAKAIGRLVGGKVRHLANALNCAVVFINQMRTNINTSKYEFNVGTGAGFNQTETNTVTGGRALAYYASLRMKLEHGGAIQDETGNSLIDGSAQRVRIGNKIKFINVKNKLATPFFKATGRFLFSLPGQKACWDNDWDILEALEKRGRLSQASTSCTYHGTSAIGNDGVWKSSGCSKEASWKKLIGDPVLMEDARGLFRSFLEEGGLDSANMGEDITDADLNTPSRTDLKMSLGLVEDDDGVVRLDDGLRITDDGEIVGGLEV